MIVNRIWQRHFGTGIVATPDNFGLSGSPPTHPELLEYLAAEFRRSGWSVKAIHRLILLSAAYQQSSAARKEALATDPNDRLLWRFRCCGWMRRQFTTRCSPFRASFPSGLYGPYVPTERDKDGSVVVPEKPKGSRRRAIYLQQHRTQVDTLLELFDAPVMVNNCAVRSTSTVPLQSLALLNSDFVRSRAAAFCGDDRLAGDGPRPAASAARCGRPSAEPPTASKSRLRSSSCRADRSLSRANNALQTGVERLLSDAAGQQRVFVCRVNSGAGSSMGADLNPFAINRRAFLANYAGGIGVFALAHLLQREARPKR